MDDPPDHDEDRASSGDHAGHDHHPHPTAEERVTAPMQEFSTAQVGVGFLVLVVGLVVTFGLPLLL